MQFLVSAVIFTMPAMIPLLVHADAASVMEVGRFSSATEGARAPNGWEPLTFKKVPGHTQYEIVMDGDTAVVQATSKAAASGLTRKISIDLQEYPLLQWRWKVSNLIKNSDIYSKDGDDYAARLYITFQYDPKKVGFWKRSKYKAAQLLFGEIPIAAINYIWETKAPIETMVDNAYTDFVKMIVVESGKEKVGLWVKEERNLYEDYKKAFGEAPPLVNGIAIMTDTDNTGERAIAYYGDIVFKKAKGNGSALKMNH